MRTISPDRKPGEGVLRFASVIKIRGINPYVLLSAERAAQLRENWRKPMPVFIRINGLPNEPWKVNLMPAGDGSFYLYLHETVRVASGTRVGDEVSVEIVFDGEYRNGPQHRMPDWFRGALSRHAKAKTAWEILPPSRKKEILRYFANLKSNAAKVRNEKRVLDALAGSKVRFMGRDWKDGR